MERVIGYIDGFNLYYGLKEAKLKRFYWLDPVKLLERFIKPHQNLVAVKYFTARITGPPGKRSRQNAFLEALSTLPKLRVIQGWFLDKPRTCYRCNQIIRIPEEKMTDAAIATELSFDACLDRVDVAFVVSGDSDLVPPVRSIRKEFPKKQVVVLFPPRRYSTDLSKSASATIKIWKTPLRQSQMPDVVVRSDGHQICRPAEWK